MSKKLKIVIIFLTLLVAIAIVGIFFFRAPKVKRITHNWVQTNWKDGADSINFPKHPDDKDRTWKKYYQKDEEIATPGDETDGDLTLASTTGSLIQTMDKDFKAGIFASTTVLGTGTEADVILDCKGLDRTCHRKPINISNSGSALTDYQVLVTLDTASLISAKKLQSDCDDLRFTDSDEKTLLNYWLESGCNINSTKIWVRVPSIPTGKKTIYLYYDNPLANSMSNGKETFLAFDWKFDGPIGGRTSLPSNHTCALLSDGKIRCWGRNDYGQLGDGTLTERTTPISVSDVINAVAVATGRFHTCVLISDGSVKCWGDNRAGQLGDATTIPRITPVSVSRIDAKSITAGHFHTCALLLSGMVKCWGGNELGQLGDGTVTGRTWPLPPVSGLTNTVIISGGAFHTCALLSDGTVKCWGGNDHGQLGDGTESHKTTPVSVSGLSNVVAIGAGSFHTCALVSDGSVKCWGDNYFGQLGNGTITSSNTPVSVSGLTNAVNIAVGGWHTCALLSDGTVKCWGANDFGELGDGTTIRRNIPVSVSGLSNVVAIGAGDSHACALLSDGTAKCWGLNTHGQLGDGTTTKRTTPVPVLGFNLGGKYEKSGGILIIPNPNTDVYFVRQFAYPEPMLKVGAEEVHYYSAGQFTSSVIDFGPLIEFTAFSWTVSTSSLTNIKFQISTSPDNRTWSDFLGPDGTPSTYYTTSGTTIWLGHNGNRYLRYKAYLETTDTSQTPRMHDLTIAYKHYPASASLISSPYNTNHPDNILNKIRWAESIAPGITDVKFQLRTAPDLAGKPGTWISWPGPDGADNTFFTDPTGREKLPSTISDGINDQWIQYKVFLTTTDGSQTPILSEVSLEYAIKMIPQ